MDTPLSYASIIVNWSDRARRILSSMDGLNGAILSSEFRPRSASSAPWARRVAIAVGIRSTPRNVPDIRDWKGAIRARKCSKEQVGGGLCLIKRLSAPRPHSRRAAGELLRTARANLPGQRTRSISMPASTRPRKLAASNYGAVT
jgi:hypothetical protein